MKTPAGKECPYFYGDYYRGREREECRLLPGNTPEKNWTPNLCTDCPVPDITQANSCEFMTFDLRVARSWFGLRRDIEAKSYCTKCECVVDVPQVGCGQCHPNIPDFIIGE